MGWMEEHKVEPAEKLARAVRKFLEHGTTGNREKMAEALAEYDARPRINITLLPPGAYM